MGISSIFSLLELEIRKFKKGEGTFCVISLVIVVLLECMIWGKVSSNQPNDGWTVER